MMHKKSSLFCVILGWSLQAGYAQNQTETQDGPIGWVTMDTLGQNGITGGAGGEVVTATSGGEFKDYAGRSGPLIIRVSGEFSIGTASINSNKTIEGAEPGARLLGSLSINKKQNIIIRNIVLRNQGGGADGIPIVSSHHVWIDHCDLSNSGDEIISMTYGCDFITVSWTKIWYSYSDKGHRFSVLMSNSDGAGGSDAGKLNVTFHHNWWADNVDQRMPRWRFGKVHVYNNYYSAEGNTYCVGCGRDGKAVVQNNYFDNVNNPHIFFNDDPSAQIMAVGNVYMGVSASPAARRDSGQGDSFVPPYEYRLDPGETIKEIVTQGAGPFNTTPVVKVIRFSRAKGGLELRIFNSREWGYDAAGRYHSTLARPRVVRFHPGSRSGLPLFSKEVSTSPALE